MRPEDGRLLLYWIEERYHVYLKKRLGLPPPWSPDPVFQETYFCNVHRENDKVTKFIREYYSDFVGQPLFEYNMVLARFLNWPDSLREIGYLPLHRPSELLKKLEDMAQGGRKVWGGAYVITTHGIPMGKAAYLCQNVLEGVYRALDEVRTACRGPSCAIAAQALQGVEGIGSFLSAQVVADLKNTPRHELYSAADKRTFVQHGPGSLRGASWFHFGSEKGVTPANWKWAFGEIRNYVDVNWPESVPPVDNQDLQNCLCEYDKYRRVKSGTGRSKRKYNGQAE